METFVRVVDTGSFSAAARGLGMGQPAVSKLIAALEARLQVRLLVRSTRRLAATEAGLAFYNSARRAIDEADAAEDNARGLGQGLTGRLRVCAPVTFARLHIVPALAAFLDAHPRLQLDLVMDDRNIDLLEENIDLAFRLGTLADSTLTARRLASADRLVLAAADYIVRHGLPTVPADLLSHRAIVYGQPVGGREWRFRQGTAETTVAVPARMICTAAEGVREAVLASLGIAIGSRWMFAPELADGRVVALLPDWKLPPIDLWAVFPTGRLPTAKASAFVAWLGSSLGSLLRSAS